MTLAGGNDKVIWRGMLHQEMHGLHIFRRPSPVSDDVDISEVQLLLVTAEDTSDSRDHLARDKAFPRNGDSWLNKIPRQAKRP